MQITLGMAKELIAPTFGAGAFGVSDPAVAINKAIRALAAMSGWKCLRRTVRFTATAPEFSLPQGCDGLVRVCVNGHPASVRDRGFTFLQSGIGANPPPGYVEVPVRNVVDMGFYPLQERLRFPVRLLAVSGSPVGVSLDIRARTPDGLPARLLIPVVSYDIFSGDASESDSTGGSLSSLPTASVDSVSIVGDPSSPITLYALDGDPLDSSRARPVAVYHPSVKAPSFRWYRMPGLRPGTPVDILAETRIDPLPLVGDSDVLPFTTVEPIEWMIRADWESRSGEVDRAQKYRDMASAWLMQHETVDETVQEPVIVNSIFDGSPGEISEDSWNI